MDKHFGYQFVLLDCNLNFNKVTKESSKCGSYMFVFQENVELRILSHKKTYRTSHCYDSITTRSMSLIFCCHRLFSCITHRCQSASINSTHTSLAVSKDAVNNMLLKDNSANLTQSDLSAPKFCKKIIFLGYNNRYKFKMTLSLS